MTRHHSRNTPPYRNPPPPEMEGTRRVALVRPGVCACGPYLAGEEFDVPAAEAERLVTHKGFRYVDTSDRTAISGSATTTQEEH